MVASMQKHNCFNAKQFITRLIAAGFFLLLSPGLWAAVQLEVDRTRVTAGETVTLTFLTDDAKKNLDSDFSSLEADFEILDRRSETQLSIVNGRQTAVVRLLLTVEPKRAGELVIPAFDFGGDSTAPVTLQVDPAPELAPGELPPVFIEVELTPGEGPYYVHAQFGLVVRVFYQQNLTEAAISQPEPTPASVRLLQETPYQAERGGERYRVLERHYAIFPERSGELVIPAMELSGRLVERRSDRIWQSTSRGRRIRAASDALNLTIEPRPAGFGGEHWQPARNFKISQQISSADALRVGEPVTRTVLIDAVGLEENMIVEPRWPELENARIYPDQPQGITRDDGRWVLGHKEFRYAVVPEKEGDLVLPELQVKWWDTKNNVQKTALLPAHTLFVQPSTLVPPTPEVVQPQPVPDALHPPAPATVVREAGYWRWLTALFAVLWVATLILAWRWKQGNRQDARSQAASAMSEDEAGLLKNLQRACSSGDRAAARTALQHWLRRFGPAGEASLLEFAAVLDDAELKAGLYALDSDGFRRDGEGSWSGRVFWKQFEAWRKRPADNENGARAPLSDLYAPENRT